MTKQQTSKKDIPTLDDFPDYVKASSGAMTFMRHCGRQMPTLQSFKASGTIQAMPPTCSPPMIWIRRLPACP